MKEVVSHIPLGGTLVPFIGKAPTRWSYSYDGKTLKVQEWLDTSDEKDLIGAEEFIDKLGFPCKREGNRISLEVNVDIKGAVLTIFGEMLFQAIIYGLLPAEMSTTFSSFIINMKHSSEDAGG